MAALKSTILLISKAGTTRAHSGLDLGMATCGNGTYRAEMGLPQRMTSGASLGSPDFFNVTDTVWVAKISALPERRDRSALGMLKSLCCPWYANHQFAPSQEFMMKANRSSTSKQNWCFMTMGTKYVQIHSA